jgi:hypothetical protein
VFELPLHLSRNLQCMGSSCQCAAEQTQAKIAKTKQLLGSNAHLLVGQLVLFPQHVVQRPEAQALDVAQVPRAREVAARPSPRPRHPPRQPPQQLLEQRQLVLVPADAGSGMQGSGCPLHDSRPTSAWDSASWLTSLGAGDCAVETAPPESTGVLGLYFRQSRCMAQDGRRCCRAAPWPQLRRQPAKRWHCTPQGTRQLRNSPGDPTMTRMKLG